VISDSTHVELEVATLEAPAAPAWLALRAPAPAPPAGVSVLSQSFCRAASGLDGVADGVDVAGVAEVVVVVVAPAVVGARPSNMDDRALRLVLLVGVVGVVMGPPGVDERAGVPERPELRLSGRHGLIGVGLSGLAPPPLIIDSFHQFMTTSLSFFLFYNINLNGLNHVTGMESMNR